MHEGRRVIAVVPSPADLHIIAEFLVSHGIEVLPASCLLEAILQQVAVVVLAPA